MSALSGMGRRWGLLPLFVVAMMLACAHLAAQSNGEALAACKSEEAALEARISACTRVIGETGADEELRIEAYLQRGVLFEVAGDKDAAIKDYSAIIELDPTHAVAHFNRGNVHDQRGNHDLAIADYT